MSWSMAKYDQLMTDDQNATLLYVDILTKNRQTYFKLSLKSMINYYYWEFKFVGYLGFLFDIGIPEFRVIYYDKQHFNQNILQWFYIMHACLLFSFYVVRMFWWYQTFPVRRARYITGICVDASLTFRELLLVLVQIFIDVNHCWFIALHLRRCPLSNNSPQR